MYIAETHCVSGSDIESITMDSISVKARAVFEYIQLLPKHSPPLWLFTHNSANTRVYKTIYIFFCKKRQFVINKKLYGFKNTYSIEWLKWNIIKDGNSIMKIIQRWVLYPHEAPHATKKNRFFFPRTSFRNVNQNFTRTAGPSVPNASKVKQRS